MSGLTPRSRRISVVIDEAVDRFIKGQMSQSGVSSEQDYIVGVLMKERERSIGELLREKQHINGLGHSRSRDLV